jgi:hypothetical protein
MRARLAASVLRRRPYKATRISGDRGPAKSLGMGSLSLGTRGLRGWRPGQHENPVGTVPIRRNTLHAW